MKSFLLLFLSIVFINCIYSQSIDIKDGEANTLIQINDEGNNGGSILFPDISTLDITINKLYNIGGELHWDGVLIGSCNCDVTKSEFDAMVLDFSDLDSRITALESD